MRRQILKYGATGLVGALLAAGVAWLTWPKAATCSYPLINPSRCQSAARFINPDYSQVKNQIDQAVIRAKAQGVTEVAVAFRDLRNGPAFSVNEEKVYQAGSLFKLPVMMRYLKDAETNPSFLDQEITAHLTSLPAVNQQTLPPDQTIQDGQQYTVRELLRRMISYSDNNSYVVLVDTYRQRAPSYDIITDTLVELGIADPIKSGDPDGISTGAIASIFRQLYNASYLNPEYSELALTWMKNSSFRQGIAAPIPSKDTVANKFGFTQDNGKKQLRDCGIIYYPQHPYVLCVMANGDQEDALVETIATISNIVYSEVNQRYGE